MGIERPPKRQVMSDFTRRVLDIVLANPGICTRDIADGLNEPMPKVQQSLANLRKARYIYHTGKNSLGGGWEEVRIPKSSKEFPLVCNGTMTDPLKLAPWDVARAGADSHTAQCSVENGVRKPWSPPTMACVGFGVEKQPPATYN